MGFLDKLIAPFRGGAAQKQGEAEREALEHQRRETYLKEIMDEFVDAERIRPKPYRELSIGESKTGRTPAVEYLQASGAVRLYNLLPLEQMNQAALIDALAMRLDDLPPGSEVGDVVDVKPKDMASIEHGAINLGPVPEFMRAAGQRWRFFVELSYSAASGSGRGGIQTRRFIADCTL